MTLILDLLETIVVVVEEDKPFRRLVHHIGHLEDHFAYHW